MKQILIYFALVVLAFTFNSCSKTRVYHLSVNPHKKVENGIIYNLPQTALIINVDVEKSIKVRGPYADFATKLLGLKNVITANETTYDIKNIKIETLLVADTSHYYLIKHRSRPFSERNRYNSQSYFFTDHMNLISMNKLPTTQAYKPQDSFEINIKSQTYPNLFNLYADVSQVEKIDTVYEIVKMDTIVMSKPIIRRTLVAKTPAQRAEEAADYILKFRLKRFELLSAYQEIPYSKEAFEFLTSQLEKTENQYLELFTGITLSEINHYQFIFIPTKEHKNSKTEIFRFSSERGITDKLDFESEMYALQFRSLSNSEVLDTLIKKNIYPSKYNGIAYRIPEQNLLLITINDEPIKQYFNIPILQFGNIHYLPLTRVKFEIDNTSGSLRNVRY